MATQFDKKAALEVFDDFIFIMDDKIEALQEEAEKYGFDLDLSKESVALIEDCFDVLVQPGKSAFDQGSLVVVFGRYLGEVLRLTVGGRWILSIDNPKNLYFNQPVIVGHRPSEVEFAPTFVMRAYSIRREKGTVARAFEAHSTPPKRMDFSHLLKEEELAASNQVTTAPATGAADQGEI